MSGHHDRQSFGGEMAQQMQNLNTRMVSVDVNEFIRTRDALASAYLNLSSSFERAVKAYLDHTQVVLNGDATLNPGLMMSAFGGMGGGYNNPAQMASMALQHNGGMMPEVKSEEPDPKKRTKRPYKPRDPNAPKRPLTAYFRYLGEVRPEITAEVQSDPEKYKDMVGQAGDITKIATARWTQLSEDEKLPYKQAYRDELVDYTRKADLYKNKDGENGEVKNEPVVVGADEVDAPGEDDEDANDSSSDDSADTASDEEEEEAPAPPPKAATPKKSSMKKTKTPATTAAAPPLSTQQSFSSIPAQGFSSVNTAAAPPSSPTRKRKGDASEETEESSKRTRKSKKTVTAAADPVAPVAQMAAPPAPVKKERKKKSKSDA
ncbi:hypothetical protein LTR09_003742 [Extremus antarcticus]|uniref:HMG box domain-containing protein n=1 Tax=Extremus antarcticus TaxID=702011 RepID=A0AAJ0DJB0_9PEZI|nr:hypothetical protein LTR09_003742 [Extremus antarcticus]